MSDWSTRRIPSAARALAVAALLFGGSAVLGACTAQLAKLPGIGEPDYIPKRPEEPGAYPAIYDAPPPRDTKLLTVDERKKLEADLVTLRSRQQDDAAAEKKSEDESATKKSP